MKCLTIIIVGGGIAGLAVALGLARAGYHVILLEAQPYLGSKSSTRNHGWLHHSGRFYLLIHGLDVVELCQEGAQEILRIAPSCLEPCHGCYFVTDNLDRAQRYTQACEAAGFSSEEVSVKALCKHEPALRGSPIRAAFAVSDQPFRPALVLDALYKAAVAAGASVRCETRVQGFRYKFDRIVAVQCEHNGSCEGIPADFVINATGAYSKQLLQASDLDATDIRIFKSSLLAVERAFTNSMLISLDAKGATVIPHGDGARTVVGVNNDSQVVEALEESQSDQVSVITLLRGMVGLIPNARPRNNKGFSADIWSCHKVEFVSPANTNGRSPGYAVMGHEVSNLLTSLPGKFTTALVMASAALAAVRERLPL